MQQQRGRLFSFLHKLKARENDNDPCCGGRDRPWGRGWLRLLGGWVEMVQVVGILPRVACTTTAVVEQPPGHPCLWKGEPNTFYSDATPPGRQGVVLVIPS